MATQLDAMAPAELLAQMCQDDWREHGAVPPMGSAEYSALRGRDRERRAAAEVALKRLIAAGTATPVDLYHAAWLFQHSDDADDVRRAHELALKSASDEERARWNVPSIASQRARAQLLARSEPQPPLDLAPVWLREAIERWRS